MENKARGHCFHENSMWSEVPAQDWASGDGCKRVSGQKSSHTNTSCSSFSTNPTKGNTKSFRVVIQVTLPWMGGEKKLNEPLFFASPLLSILTYIATFAPPTTKTLPKEIVHQPNQ